MGLARKAWLLTEIAFSGYMIGVSVMRTIRIKATARAVWLVITLVMPGLLWVLAPGQASAGFCSATSCSLTLTNSNFIGTGKFGTVSLALTANVVTVDVNLASAYRIVKTGFPGAVGFADNVGGGLTIGDFKTSGAPTPLYSGYLSSTPGCVGNDCHWDGFGYANNAAATDGPKRPLSLQELSFSVSKGTSISDVHQLLRQFTTNGKNGAPYFVVDGCVWNPLSRECGRTGLFVVTQVPEPASIAILVSSLLLLFGWLRWKRVV